MKRITLLMLSIIVFNTYALSQWTKPDRIVLNGKTVIKEASNEEIKQKLAYKANANDQFNKEYLIVQFSKIPTIKEQSDLETQGIKLLDYVQGNAYFAVISPNFYHANTTDKIGVLYEIKPEYKISQQIASGIIPEYAKTSANTVKFVISVFDGADKKQIENDLRLIDAESVVIDLRFKQANISINPSKINHLASLSWVQNIDFVSPPRKFENNEGRTSHKANVLNSNILGIGYNLTGKGVKLGIWDGDVDKHRDFGNRLFQREYEMHTTDHGTHTAGTIAGAGILDPKARGMAPDLLLYSWNFNNQSNGLTEAQERVLSLDNDGIEITSNSWGYSVSSCPNPFAYGDLEHNEDLVANWYPYFLYVFSGGNSQSACPDGYQTTSKNLKNSLVVAAIDREDNITTFSSFGPTFDGRLLPNISGDGLSVYSTFLNNTYGVMSGTSMATPGVAGTMALIYQRYKETHAGKRPLSSFLRALACNTAHDLGNPGPDYKYGYGSINGLRAVEVMEQNNYFTNTVSQGINYSKTINVPAGALGLKVMLAWTDVEGTPGAAKVLVNDLDLKVINNGNTTLPWILDPLNPNNDAVRGVDNLNNLEQVTIDNPAAGIYTISVDGSLIPSGTQDFAIVYDIVMPQFRFTYPIGNETFNPGNLEVIRWDCEGYNQPFTIEYSVDEGNTFTVIATNVSANVRNFVWKVPSISTSKAKFRISSGSSFTTTPGVFNIEPTPVNIKVSPVLCNGAGPFTLTWDAIANANYKVYKLNGQNFEFLADVTTNSYDITGITSGNENLYCVRAIDKTTGALSERSLAIEVNPSLPVSSLPFSEKFESLSAPNFYFTNSTNGKATVQYVTDNQKFGLRFEGTSNPAATPAWVAGTMANCFTNNQAYISKATICNIDASSFAGKNIALKFDYRQKWKTAVGTTYFRVKVNGTYLTNIDGVQIYGTTQTINYTTAIYDLSAYAGNSSITIEFEAVNKTNYVTYVSFSGSYNFADDTRDKGDFVTIDNVEIYETPKDIAITAVTPSSGITSAETIGVTVKNLSAEAISNIPVSYQIGTGAVVTEVFAGPVAPFSAGNYTFNQTADFSANGVYTIIGRIDYNGDVNYLNDSVVAKKVNNGTDILMPYGVSATPGTGTYTTCGAIFTDNGGRYSDYPFSQSSTVTFKPDAAGKSMKITFSEFDLENTYDKLLVYNGPGTTSPLLYTLTGSTIPESITSTAVGGELTFKFTCDNVVNKAGWVATIECVTNPSIDVAITGLTPGVTGTAAEVISVKLFNYGNSAISNIPVSYQVGTGTTVEETIPGPVASYTSTIYNFTQTADMSVPGNYTVTASVNYIGDEKTENNSKTVTRESDGPGIYRMGVSKGTILTCSGILTDIGGPNGIYPNNEKDTLIIKPDIAGKKAKLTFTEFDLDSEWDEIYIYDGPSVTSPLIATLIDKTTVVPISFTSSATNGELTVRFKSDSYENYSGFKATIECVDYTASSDAGVIAVLPIIPGRTANSVITATIKNFGNTTLSNITVAYKIDANTEVTQVVAGPLAQTQTVNVTFTTKGNFSSFNTTYNLDVYTKLAGDANADNDKTNVQVKTTAITATNSVANFYAINSTTPAIITAPALTSTNLTSIYSVETWIKPSTPLTFGRVFDKYNVGLFYQTSPAYSLAYPENTYILVVYTTSSAYFYYYYPGTVTPNQWQHVAITANAGVYKFYIDGVEQTPVFVPGTSGAPAATATNATKPFYIGNVSGYTRGVVGQMDEFRVWNTTLSQATISANMNTDYAANTSGLVAYYKFKETNGNYVYDYSSNDNTATITGANTTNTGDNQFWSDPGPLLEKLGIVGEKIPSTFDPATNTYKSIINGSDYTNLVAKFKAIAGAVIKVGATVQTSGVTVNDFGSGSLSYSVEGAGFNTGISQTFTLNVETDLNDATDLTSFKFEQVNNAGLTSDIDLVQSGTSYYVKNTTIDASALKATFTASTNAKVYINGVLQTSPQSVAMDYAKGIIIKVVAENNRDFKYWTVNVDQRNNLAGLIDFSIANQQGATAINSTDKTISCVAKYNKDDVRNIIPSFVLQANANAYVGTIKQYSGITANDFTNDVVYKIVSEDGSNSADWNVHVTMAQNTEALITGFTIPNQVGNSVIDHDAKTIKLIFPSGTLFDNLVANFVVSDYASVKVNNVAQISGASSNNFNTPVVYAITSQDNSVTNNYTVTAHILANGISVKGAGNATNISTVGGTLQMEATLLPADATTKNVNWSVVNVSGEASISATGLLTAIKNGDVTVVAKTTDGTNLEASVTITISGQTDINSVQLANSISVYPNPASDVFKISVDKSTMSIFNVKISDLSGRLIYTKLNCIGKTIEISEKLPKGAYIITVYDNYESIQQELIIQ